MSNEINAKYKIYQESGEYTVWKVDESGKKLERKNDTPYKSHADALAYMRALYSHMPKSEATLENPIIASETQLILGAVHFEADTDPRFLRFHDAVLARAETNSNRDHIDEDGVNELASTIVGTPIDLEHDPKKNIGFYTAGKSDNGALKVDGVVWIDRCEALGIEPADIESGKYKLSIEAEAQTARCSVCDTVHDSVASYCKHLKNKAIYGATRFLNGLRARGGAITKTPAGSETAFSTMLFIASHQEENMENELTASDVELIEGWINEVVSAITKREDVTPADKKRAESEAEHFADPVNKKYKLDTESQVRAAWSYINMPKNAAKYSSEEVKAIKSRIKRAGKKYNIEYANDDKKSKSESSLEESIMADTKPEAETPEEEKKPPTEETNEEEANMDVQYQKMKKDMDMMCSELEAKKAELVNEQKAKAELGTNVTELEARIQSLETALQASLSEVKASRVATLKSQLVGAVMTEEEFAVSEERLLSMDNETIALLIKAATKHESTEAAKKPENRVLASETAPSNGRVKLVL